MRSLFFLSVTLALLGATAVAWLHDTTPVDCIQSQWSEWRNVGVDTHVRNRVTLRYASDGGTACGPNEEAEQLPDGERVTTSDTARAFDAYFLRVRPDSHQRTTGLQQYDDMRDLLIILDDSGSIGATHFHSAKRSLATVLGYICPDISRDYHQVALMTFHDTYRERFDFDRYGSYEDVKEAILEIPYAGGPRTDIHEALDFARTTMFKTNKGLREGSTKEVLLLTDGEPNNDAATVTAAERLRSAGVTVFALGIGNHVDNDLLESLVSDPGYKHIFHLDTFEDLENMVFNVEEAYNLYGHCVYFDPYGR